MLPNDNCPYTLLEVGRADASRRGGGGGRGEESDINNVSSKYFTPFNHRMMQSSFDLFQVNYCAECNIVIERHMMNSEHIINAGRGNCWSGEGEREGGGRAARTSLHSQHQPLASSTCQVVFQLFPMAISLRFIRMAGKELILGPPWEDGGSLDRD